MGKQVGHRKMVVWQNMDKMALFVNRLAARIPASQYKIKNQILNASDSVGANFVEGYHSSSTPEYLRFLYYAKRSLAELQERIRRSHFRGYISKIEYANFDDLSTKTMYLLDRLIFALKNKLK